MSGPAMEQSPPNGRLLVNELTHRINNVLASAIGVISLAAARVNNSEAKVALASAAECVQHHALVHHALQMPELCTRIDASEYIRQLCLSISRSMLDYRSIKLEFADYPASMQSDECWQLGMIVYELIADAARHAFAENGGEIRVEMFSSGTFVECRVLDNGSAPEEIRPGRGLRIIEAPVKGLAGRFAQQYGPNGSKAIVILPLRL
jgi:two-component sensor histidine kinase